MSPAEEPRPKVGVSLIIRRNGQVLVGERLSAHAKGTWCFPGGHLELHEDFATCALRETLEECGLTPSTPWLGAVTNDVFPDGKHYITLHMVADWLGGEAQTLEPHKICRWEWCAWNDLPTNLMRPLANLQAMGFNPMTASTPLPTNLLAGAA